MTETTTAAATKQWQGLTIPAPGTFVIDPAHTNIGFVARHMMVTKVRGSFTDLTGTIELADDPTQSSVEVTVMMPSITTGSGDRDGHLRSPDFFDVQTYPEMIFRSSAIRHVGGDKFVITGDLTVRDVTKSVDLDVTFEGAGVNPWGTEVAGVSARAEIDREDWGLTWNAPLETGGVLVSKKVVLEIEIQAKRA